MNAADATTSSEKPFDPSSSLTLRYENGVLEASFNCTSLNTVLGQIANHMGIKFVLNDPSSGQRQVSATIKATTFMDGIKAILEGNSYVIYSAHQLSDSVVTILSTPAKESSCINPVRTIASAHTAGTLLDENAGDLVTLDQFSARSGIQETPLTNVQGNNPDPTPIETDGQLENRLTRALDALDSNLTQLHAQAVDELADIDNATAVQALIRVVLGNNVDDSIRLRAVGALAQHTAYQQFTDLAAVDALHQLAHDTNKTIRNIAEQSLKEFQVHQQINNGEVQ
jgi:hypothetical protein